MTEVEVPKSTWIKKGATLSDKSARKEFGLTLELKRYSLQASLDELEKKY